MQPEVPAQGAAFFSVKGSQEKAAAVENFESQQRREDWGYTNGKEGHEIIGWKNINNSFDTNKLEKGGGSIVV